MQHRAWRECLFSSKNSGDKGVVRLPGRKCTQNTRGGYSEDTQIGAGDNGGSARGYQVLSVRLVISATSEKAGGRVVCLCIVRSWHECPHLPQTGSSSWAREDIGHATRPVSSRGRRLTGSPSRRATS